MCAELDPLKTPKTCIHAGRWTLPIGPQWQSVIRSQRSDTRASKYRSEIEQCLELGRRTKGAKA